MHYLRLMRFNMLYLYNYFRLEICYSVRTEQKLGQFAFLLANGRHERIERRSSRTRYLRNGCARHQAVDMHYLRLMRFNMLYLYNYFRLEICYSVRTEPKLGQFAFLLAK